MKILITGSAGFVGKHLAKSLSRNHSIVKYDLENGEDVLNEKLLLQKIKGVDLVIHLAAFISATESWQKPEKYIRNNVLGTLSVVKNSIKAGVKKLIFFSSAAVKAKPLTPYAISKISAEDILNLYKKDLRIVILRPENIYGPGQKAAYGYVIHNFIKAVKQKKEINIYGDGKQTRDFVYINDIVKTVEKIINMNIKSGSVISVGTGKQTSILELANLVMSILKSKTGVKFRDKRNEPLKSVANTDKLKSLKINPDKFIRLSSGIKKII